LTYKADTVQNQSDDLFDFLNQDEEQSFLEHQSLSTSTQDRYAALCNILRGYEEYILNTDGIVISSNLEAVNITGYEEWEIIGKHFSIFYSTEERVLGRPEEDHSAVLQSGKVVYSGWRLKKNGSSFWAKVRLAAVRDDAHQITGFRMVIKDTTHNALYNFRVKKVRDEYLNLFNNTFIGIFKFRLDDFKILLLNDKASSILNKTENDQLTFEAIFTDTNEFKVFRDKLIADGGVENFEVFTHNQKWISISCRYFAEHSFAEGILADITEKKKQFSELQRLNQEIDKFIYHSSHDLRSPLTTILGLTHLIELDKPGPVVREYNGMIREQVTQLDNLLKSLVNITFNNTDLMREKIDVRKEINIILRDFVHEFKQVQVSTSVKGERTFHSDPSRLHIILKNLISNAFRFQNPHNETQSIQITALLEKQKLSLEVHDNGIGIDSSCIPNIFSMFYKAERGSTGLGLYIVKSMVEKLQGTIHVESVRWQGSTFRITLPNTKE
jgi:PAS domain S-box-containing protein